MPKPHGGKLLSRVLKGRKRKEALETAGSLEIIEVSDAVASDIENIAKGVFSPLEGFMNQEELEAVLHSRRLPSDLAWTIPILLDVSKSKADRLNEGEDIALYFKGKPLALMCLEEKLEQ